MTTNLSKKDRLPQIRVFAAIELPEDLRVHLALLRSHFGAPADAAKWVAPELLHVTMRFLGEIPQDRLDALLEAAGAAGTSTDPFRLEAGRPGAFPSERNPRVLWVGLEGDSGLTALRRLHCALERALEEHGFGGQDQPFSPHITVARLRERSRPDQRRTLAATLMNLRNCPTGPARSFPVEALTVMRSDLRPGGPRYSPLVRIPLVATSSTVDAEAAERTSIHV